MQVSRPEATTSSMSIMVDGRPVEKFKMGSSYQVVFPLPSCTRFLTYGSPSLVQVDIDADHSADTLLYAFIRSSRSWGSTFSESIPDGSRINKS